MSEPDQVVPVDDENEQPYGPRVVVGVDGSSGARAALLFALADAARRGVPLHVVSAHRPPDAWMDFYALDSASTDRVHSDALAQARKFVAEVTPEGPQPPPVLRVSAVLGATADVLTRAGEGADLLVVGSRGRGGLSSMLLGSTSMQVVTHATCPVTVVHSEQSQAHRERLHLRRRKDHEREVGLAELSHRTAGP